MPIPGWLAAVALLGPIAGGAGDGVFEYSVRHRHALRDCSGALRITGDGVEYRASKPADARTWKFEEIRVLKIESPRTITVVTYEDQRRLAGKDRVFTLTLVEGKVPGELSEFLLARVKRPMVVSVVPEAGKPVFQFRAKHLHRFGGALGTVRVYPERVVFESSRTGDSRVWRLEDIERFGRPERYRFQIGGLAPRAGGPTEEYDFELMEDLPEGLYDYLWVRLHPSSYYPERIGPDRR